MRLLTATVLARFFEYSKRGEICVLQHLTQKDAQKPDVPSQPLMATYAGGITAKLLCCVSASNKGLEAWYYAFAAFDARFQIHYQQAYIQYTHCPFHLHCGQHKFVQEYGPIKVLILCLKRDRSSCH